MKGKGENFEFGGAEGTISRTFRLSFTLTP
jgi:hypothetical protein